MLRDSNLQHDAVDIDLRMLVVLLWRQRYTILFVTIFALFSGVAFAFLIKPTYEARAFVIPPTSNDIANFNFGRIKENNLSPFTIKDVYDVFTRNLQSESLRREFFNKFYLPSISESERADSQDAQYASFAKWLTISVSNKDSPDKFLVTVRDNDAAKAVLLAGKYIARASELAKKEMMRNIGSEADVLARNLHQEINLLREVGLKGREDSIAKLEEALHISEAIGLDKPPIVSGNPAVQIAGSLSGQLLYMRGAKALKAEISNLQSRNSDDPFIETLRAVQTKYNFFNQLESNISNVEVFRMDGVIEMPDRPVAPNKPLIVLVGLMLGIVAGVVLALLRNFFSENRVRLI